MKRNWFESARNKECVRQEQSPITNDTVRLCSGADVQEHGRKRSTTNHADKIRNIKLGEGNLARKAWRGKLDEESLAREAQAREIGEESFGEGGLAKKAWQG